ncbi:MAG: hypothetical protein RMM53_00025 [Bacteroidia bacterium]|nr:hypothetical protein [Bacteroidia bacterium]MDW8332581.1 hypothetical protein [Bacteroidia bacterium]
MERTVRNEKKNRAEGASKLKIVPFDRWSAAELERAFDLQERESAPELTEWTSVRHPIPENIFPWVESLRLTLRRMRNYWNEDELRLGFIGPLLYAVNFQGRGYNFFAGRTLGATINGVKLVGKPDAMVATGEVRPERPYFFLHEYKRMHVGSPDPLGQVLAAMLAAQTLNQNGRPVYGCYTVADIWRFVLLYQNSYSVGQGYDASDKNEIQIVWSVLCETKKRIEQWAQEANP